VGRPVTARDEVLDRVRRAIGERTPVDVPREYRQADGTPALLDTFVARLEDYKAVVHTVAADEVAELLGRLTHGRYVVPAGFPDRWLSGVDVVRDEALTAAQLDRLDGVVTTCALAIAETGTIVLDAGPGPGRRALTLVPDHHVVVVRSEQVVATVPQALTHLVPSRPQTWISGPSATSDIELQRVEGVHGPRRLAVVLVADAGRHHL
jgi:L-lactate dehydrogenase complex protein LldG